MFNKRKNNKLLEKTALLKWYIDILFTIKENKYSTKRGNETLKTLKNRLKQLGLVEEDFKKIEKDVMEDKHEQHRTCTRNKNRQDRRP